jgi:hypothetical protein
MRMDAWNCRWEISRGSPPIRPAGYQRSAGSKAGAFTFFDESLMCPSLATQADLERHAGYGIGEANFKGPDPNVENRCIGTPWRPFHG